MDTDTDRQQETEGFIGDAVQAVNSMSMFLNVTEYPAAFREIAARLIQLAEVGEGSRKNLGL